MYLVTGGAGFIGSHIVRRLVAEGKQVRVLDNFFAGTMANLDGLNGAVEVIMGDILDPQTVENAMKGVQVVLHQAALRSVPYSVEHPALVNRVNVEGTINVLLAARDGGVKRVVFASSSSVYGSTKVSAGYLRCCTVWRPSRFAISMCLGLGRIQTPSTPP
jgi:UDP-glucose 4-epimerase